jgi:hypothetical protein
MAGMRYTSRIASAPQTSEPHGRRRDPIVVASLLLFLAAVVGFSAALELGAEPSLRASAPDAGTATLAWTAFDGTATVAVRRDGRLLDALPARAREGEYADRLLWERTTYRYEVDFLDASGARLGRLEGQVTTPARRAVERLYADGAWVNTPVGGSPVHPDSAAIVRRAVTGHRAGANFSVSDDWGIPIAVADRGSPRVVIACERFGCGLDVPPHRIPASASPSLGSDRHLVVLDPGARTELDLWLARRDGGAWAAGSRWVTRTDGPAINCRPGERCSGANAANLPLAAGVVRPEEIAAGQIEHALALTTPQTRAGSPACPAIASDGRVDDPAAVPIGARLRLDPGVDVDRLPVPPWQRTIARALQTYGAVLVDTAGSLAIRGESTALRGYDAWAKAGVPRDDPSLAGLPLDRMQVLAFESCPDTG